MSVALPGTARRGGILHDDVGQINYAACQTEGETLLYHGDAWREREVLGNTWATAQCVVYNLIALCLDNSSPAHSEDTD